MLIFWILFFYLLYFSLKYINNKTSNYYIFTNICFVYIFLIYSLRSYCVGTDTYGYLSTINSLKEYSYGYIVTNLRDPFFYIIVKFLKSFLDYNIVVFSFIGFVFIYFVGNTLKKQSDNIFLSLLVLLVFRYIDFPMNAMRNGLAIPFAFYSLNFLISNKIKKFVFFVIIASLFHKSLLVYLILLPLSYINFQKINKSLFFFILCLSAIFIEPLYNTIFVHFFVGQYELYQNNSENASKILTFLIVAFFYIIIFWGISFKDDMSRKNKILFISVSLSFIFSLLATVNPIMGRMALAFGFPFALIFPYVVSKFSTKFKSSAKSLILIFIFSSIYLLGGPAPGVIPYSFFWNPQLNSTHTMPGARSPFVAGQKLPILP